MELHGAAWGHHPPIDSGCSEAQQIPPHPGSVQAHGLDSPSYTHTPFFPIQYPIRTDTHPYHAAPPLQGLNLSIFLRYGILLLTKVIAHFLLHPSLPSAHGALNRKADASLGMSAGVCPNEAGVKSLPSASLPCSYQLSSVSNMLDMFLFSVKKKKSNLFSNYKRI